MARLNDCVMRGFEKLLAMDGVTIQYVHGEKTLTLRALRDSVVVESGDTGGVSLNRETMVWAVRRGDMVWDNRLFLPARGDRILSEGETLEVVDGPNRRPWDMEEVSRQILTIFTQVVQNRSEAR